MVRPLIAFALFLVSAAACHQSQTAELAIRLYALDCGRLEVTDMSSFSRQGRLDGETGSLVVPCFLIRHPKGDLLWDLGYPESLADTENGIEFQGFHQTVSRKLTDQLSELSLTPSEVDYVAISHSHLDHVGNGNLFAESTFIANRAEHEFMFSAESRDNNVAFENYSELEYAPTIFFDTEHDVFDDGTVVVTSMPGHTPGSSTLLVRLYGAGAVLLTGDLYTHERARELQTIPVFNLDAIATVDSRARFEEIAKRESARVVIQHARSHFEALPIFPAFLE